MSLFQIDPDTGDLERADGAFIRVSGLEEIRQACNERVQLIRSEAKFAKSKGVPHFPVDGTPTIFQKGLPTQVIANIFQAEIADVAGVEAVTETKLTQDDAQRAARTADLSYTARVSLDELRNALPVQDTVSVKTG